MPARVTYWTGTWDDEKEAISKEIAALRVGSRARAPVIAFSPANRTGIDATSRVIRLSSERWLLLRAAAAVFERTADVSHVFGGFGSWHLLRALGRRPVLVTAVAGGAPGLQPRLPVSVAIVAIEAEGLRDEWLAAGLPGDRIRTVYPGADLDWFKPAPLPSADRITLLFASSPADVGEFEGRGIPLLVDLARSRPDVDILLPWRQWGQLSEARAGLDALRPPPNFKVWHEPVPDMRRFYERSHAVLAPFGNGVGKACPNSLVEGFACGRPAIVTSDCGISSLVRSSGAGVVAARDVAALSAAVDQLTAGLPTLAAAARELAETHFSLPVYRTTYDNLYQELAAIGADARLR